MGYSNGYDSGYSDCETENRSKWTQEGFRKGQESIGKLLAGVEFKGEQASLGETRSALTTLWTRLGGTIACVIFALACDAAAPGYAKVSDLVDHEVVTNAEQAVSSCPVKIATNSIPWSAGPVAVSIESNATLSCSGAWPTGRPVFIMASPAGPYSKALNVRLIGYQDWPADSWQGVAWQVNGIYYFNILAGIDE